VDAVDNSVAAGVPGPPGAAGPHRDVLFEGKDEEVTVHMGDPTTPDGSHHAAADGRPDASNGRAASTEGGGDAGVRGSDIARSALAAARAARAARTGVPPPSGASSRSGVRRSDGSARLRRRVWSGARADERDPQTLGPLASRLSTQRGWAPHLTTGAVFGRWAELVGREVAEHSEPVALREGVLTVQAASTAWATQLRLLQRHILARLGAGLGHGVVTSLRIHGPSAPSWKHGSRHVSGRGPRDTYG